MVHRRVGPAPKIHLRRARVALNATPSTGEQIDSRVADVDQSRRRGCGPLPDREGLAGLETRGQITMNSSPPTLSDGVAVAGRSAQAVADRVEEPVPRRMTEAVVHRLESVDVHEYEGVPLSFGTRRGTDTGEQGEGCIPVEARGEPV